MYAEKAIFNINIAGPAAGDGPVFVARGSEAWFTVIDLSNISVVSTVSDTRVVGLFWTE